MGDEALELGIKVRTSSFTRHHVNITMTRAKSNGAYINSMLALQEAISGGADEALMLDPEGYVAEGSGENIFIIKDGVIYTPEVTACLNGITRGTVLTLAAEHGLKVVEKRITRDEVYIADEAFFTGTAAEVTPIREVDGRAIGIGRRGPITEKLQKAYFDLVTGKTDAHAEWRTWSSKPGAGSWQRNSLAGHASSPSAYGLELMNILIVGPSWVGDMVMAQTLFVCLKQRHPDCQIDVLAPEWSRPILERMPEVRRAELSGRARRARHGDPAQGCAEPARSVPAGDPAAQLP